MTVKEIMECCTSPVWITFDEDSRNGELEILIENTCNAEDILTEQILDHDVYLMHCADDRLIISLYTLRDAEQEDE